MSVEAALAPPGLVASLGLAVLATGVADNEHAATRFVRVGRPEAVPAPTGHDKTTLSVHLPTDRAGALLEMLEQFAVRGVNLSRIDRGRARTDRASIRSPSTRLATSPRRGWQRR